MSYLQRYIFFFYIKITFIIYRFAANEFDSNNNNNNNNNNENNQWCTFNNKIWQTFNNDKRKDIIIRRVPGSSFASEIIGLNVETITTTDFDILHTVLLDSKVLIIRNQSTLSVEGTYRS